LDWGKIWREWRIRKQSECGEQNYWLKKLRNQAITNLNFGFKIKVEKSERNFIKQYEYFERERRDVGKYVELNEKK